MAVYYSRTLGNGPGVFKLVGGIFFVVGLGLLIPGWFTGNRQYTILKKWPSVDAEVTQSRVAHYQSTSSRSSSSSTMYQAEIEFRYSVGGKPYVTPATTNYSTSSYTEMKHKVDAYAPGTHHLIRYNPVDPNDIRFDVGYTFGFFLLPVIFGGMGLIFGGLGAGLLYAGLRATQPKLQCPSCGQPVERGQHFCPNCSVPLAQ